MKKRTVRLLALLLHLLLFVQAFGVSSLCVGAATDDLTIEYYGRTALTGMPNAASLLHAYDAIVAGVAAMEETIEVGHADNHLSQEEFKMVFDAYRRDHPEHFWLGTAYTLSSLASRVVSISPTYLTMDSSIETARAEMEAAADAILRNLSDTMSEFEKELYLHDALAAKVTYVESENAHNAYGALVEGRAVCEGYAEALQYLLQRAGISSFIMLGSSVNPTTQQPESHAWNAVRIDGAYYHVDLTWNDQSSHLFHAYFNMTDAQIQEDHQITPTAYALPSCTATAAHYYSVYASHSLTPPYNAEVLAQLVGEPNKTAYFYVAQGDVSTFASWLGENLLTIAQKMGISGSFIYQTSHLSREYAVKFVTCKHTELTHVPADPATCTQNGNLSHYRCVCGELFADAAATERITADDVTDFAHGHNWSKKVEDESHLHKPATNCRENTVYKFTCSVCDAISETQFFSSAQTGEHQPGEDWSHDASFHWHACTLCQTPTDEKRPHTYADTLSSDGITHWNACTCGAKANEVKHTDENGDQLCDVCNARIAGTGEQIIASISSFLNTPIGMITVFGGIGLLILIFLVALLSRRRR